MHLSVTFISAFPFSEIVERVADVMEMYSFIHIADAFAVRPFTIPATSSLLLSKINGLVAQILNFSLFYLHRQ